MKVLLTYSIELIKERKQDNVVCDINTGELYRGTA